MGFYEQISKYYNYIFPVGRQQLKFITDAAGKPGGRILDVACGTGGYTIELAKMGYKAAAVDVDSRMVALAREKADDTGVKIDVTECDMRELASTINGNFDCIFCIGNSIVHLGNAGEIGETLKQMHSLLQSGGTIVLQIINYDRVLKYNVYELPAVENEDIGLRFVRRYEYDRQKGIIYFDTTLTIGSRDGEVYNNRIELLPVMSIEMQKLLLDAGFKDIKFYGDFNSAPYNTDSFLLVIKASK